MDALSKLGFLTSELLLRNNKVTDYYKPSEIALLLSNRSSSLETDTEHQKMISDTENYFPSPAVFVYTLPNIVAGEIAIRNGIRGENSFLIFDKFDARFMAEQTESMLESGRAGCCICGWVEYFEGNMHSFLYTVEHQPGVLGEAHNSQNLTKLFL
jgi:hypothetical protein